MSDILILGTILIAISYIIFYISFKLQEEQESLKLLMFYMGFLFIFISLFFGLNVSDQLVNNQGFKIIFITTISLMVIFLIVLIWLQFMDILIAAADKLLGSK